MRLRVAVLLVLIVALLGLGAACAPDPAVPSQATTTVDGRDVTVSGPVGAALEVAAADDASIPALPAGVVPPVGVLRITVSNIEAGSTVVVSIDVGQPVDGVKKLIAGAWDDFAFDGSTGVTLADGGKRVDLHLRDGGRGDSDGVANGVIVDPVAPYRGFGGCITGQQALDDDPPGPIRPFRVLGPIDYPGNVHAYLGISWECVGSPTGPLFTMIRYAIPVVLRDVFPDDDPTTTGPTDAYFEAAKAKCRAITGDASVIALPMWTRKTSLLGGSTWVGGWNVPVGTWVCMDPAILPDL